MIESEIKEIIEVLRRNDDELPWIEVKLSVIDKDYIGKTISALSNSAKYHEKPYGYLIWGIENKTWQTKGTSVKIETYKDKSGFIYPQIQGHLNKKITSTYSLPFEGENIFVLRVKNCSEEPVTYKKIPYIRIGERNDLLMSNPSMLEKVIRKTSDWGERSINDSTLEDIDPEALLLLREKYFNIESNKGKKLSNEQLLNALSLLDKNGRPNNNCLILLGKPDVLQSKYSNRSRMTWVYRDELNEIEQRLTNEQEQGPLLLKLYLVLENIQKFNTILQDTDLFRTTIPQYDMKGVEEILINAIVHRDWEDQLWIEIIQTPNSLEIRNPGRFRADLNEVLLKNKRPPYINPSLSNFLKSVDLMEREGGGLKKTYGAQLKKGLRTSLTHSNGENTERVDVKMEGKIKDINFATFIYNTSTLSIDQIIILEKIYNGSNILDKDITSEEFKIITNYVTKTGNAGKGLKIKKHLLNKSSRYMKSFSNTSTSPDTSKKIILDYAKENNSFTTSEIYDVLEGKSKEWVRASLTGMEKDELLVRLKRGVYSIKDQQ